MIDEDEGSETDGRCHFSAFAKSPVDIRRQTHKKVRLPPPGHDVSYARLYRI